MAKFCKDKATNEMKNVSVSYDSILQRCKYCVFKILHTFIWNKGQIFEQWYLSRNTKGIKLLILSIIYPSCINWKDLV